MKTVLEAHILQNFAPSNLNRDDTGSPKDAVFGGYRRARISSQCLKRAMRQYVQSQELLPPGHLAQRSKRLVDAIAEGLTAAGKDATLAQAVARNAFGGLGLKVKDDGKSQYLIFLGQGELKNVIQVCLSNWDALASVAAPGESGDKKTDKKGDKKASKEAVPDEVRKALEKTLCSRTDGGDAVDLALFGRMLADKADKNIDAACQVAHALSTHRVDREFDFYTAVDDLKPEDNAGADMLGTVEFNSACYYRYLNIDLSKLLENLQNDHELVVKGLEAFLEAAIKATPTGKQNSFAAHNPPSFIAFTIRENTSPRNLSNAFADPATAGKRSLTDCSLVKLAREWEKQDGFYGDSSTIHFWNGTELEFEIEGSNCVSWTSCKELVTKTVANAVSSLTSKGA